MLDQEKNYSLSAGQYFNIKIEYTDISLDEFAQKAENYRKNLSDYFIKKINRKEINYILQDRSYWPLPGKH